MCEIHDVVGKDAKLSTVIVSVLLHSHVLDFGTETL